MYFCATNDVAFDQPNIVVRIHDDDVSPALSCRQHEVMVKFEAEFVVLGSSMSCDGRTTDTITKQLKKGSKPFYEMSKFFLCRDVPIKAKFDAYVTKVRTVALSGCSCWTWSQKDMTRVSSWENLLLHRMYGGKKSPNTNWLEWSQTTLRVARMHFRKYHFPLAIEWLHRLLGFAWRFATDKTQNRATLFVRDAVTFRNEGWWTAVKSAGNAGDSGNQGKWRRATRGKPPLRWERPLIESFGEMWVSEFMSMRERGVSVKSLRSRFVDSAFECVQVSVPICARLRKLGTEPAPPKEKKARIVDRLHVAWEPTCRGDSQFIVVGDNETVVNMWNADSAVPGQYRGAADKMWDAMTHMVNKHNVFLCATHMPFFMHAYRENNVEADALATRALRTRKSWCRMFPQHFEGPIRSRAFCDGGCREGCAAFGYRLEVSDNIDAGGEDGDWRLVMLVSVFLGKATSLHAEVMGSVEAFRACCEMSLTQRVTLDSNGFVVSRVVDDVSRMLLLLALLCHKVVLKVASVMCASEHTMSPLFHAPRFLVGTCARWHHFSPSAYSTTCGRCLPSAYSTTCGRGQCTDEASSEAIVCTFDYGLE